MWIRLQPLDTVFFRDGKPFSQGEETWGDRTVFLPPPAVFYGALRSLYFSQNLDEFAKLSQNDATANLSITAVYLENKSAKSHRYLPTPRDVIVFDKEEDFAEFKFLQPVHASASSCPRPYLLKTPEGRDNKADEPDQFLTEKAYKNYLIGKEPSKSNFLATPIIAEPKVGIGRDDVTHVTGEDGRLYRVDMLRLATHPEELHREGWGFLLKFENLELTIGKGILKLGGEHKAAQYEIFNDLLDIAILPPVEPFEYFKLCLTTPAIFKSGWYPNLDKLGIELLAAAVGKPCYIGGFDMKERKPKNMYRAVPAGSVYYFKCCVQNNQKLIDELHGKAISDVYPEQGFGIAYMGKCNEHFN